MKDTVAARKYARALFAEATAKNEIRACQQGLEEMVRVFKARESLRSILMQPFISLVEKKKLVHSALGEYTTPLLERFFDLLVLRRRFDLTPWIAQSFQEEVDLSQNVQLLNVKAAYPMNEAQRKTLQQKLEAWLGSKVRMEVSVDPELIGGLVIRTRDRELDQSLKTQLKQLKEAMTR